LDYQTTILIIDDDEEIRNLIEIYLMNEGFNVLKASNGLEAIEKLRTTNVQLIILDIMMPYMDGIEACMKIRQEQNMPIIMLSAKAQDMDKIIGLATGADDYMTKPFNPLELIARVKSQLRRYTKLNVSPQTNDQSIIVVDNLVINVATHEVHMDKREVKLTPIEFSILELLARNRGIVFKADKIYEMVWKDPFFESDNTVVVHIRKIREKIEENPRKPRLIKTVWGVGYKIEN
jgi:two-component system, OmpR family, response regulator VanR